MLQYSASTLQIHKVSIAIWCSRSGTRQRYPRHPFILMLLYTHICVYTRVSQ